MLELHYTIEFSFFTESAEQGDIRAQNFLGILPLNGTGVKKITLLQKNLRGD